MLDQPGLVLPFTENPRVGNCVRAFFSPRSPGHIVTIGVQSELDAAVSLQNRVERGVIPRDGVFECFLRSYHPP